MMDPVNENITAISSQTSQKSDNNKNCILTRLMTFDEFLDRSKVIST